MKKCILCIFVLSIFAVSGNADMMLTISSAADVEATYITSFGGDADTILGGELNIIADAGDNAKPLVQFPTLFGGMNVPLGSTINSAILSLTTTGSSLATSNDPIGVHQVNVSWSEDSATWNNFGTAPGGVSGTDYVALANATLPAPTATNTTYQVDIKALVQSWSNGTANHGIMLINALNGSESAYYHSDNAASLGPSITIDYTAIPEPTAFLMLGLVGLGFGGNRFWKSRKAAK